MYQYGKEAIAAFVSLDTRRTVVRKIHIMKLNDIVCPDNMVQS
jgi:hypothetical protein